MEKKSAVLGAVGTLIAGGLAFGGFAIANADNQPAPTPVVADTTEAPAPVQEPVVTEPAVEPVIEAPAVVEPAPVVVEPAPAAPEYAPAVEPVAVQPAPAAPVYTQPAPSDLPALWTPGTPEPVAPGMAPRPNPQPPGEGYLK